MEKTKGKKNVSGTERYNIVTLESKKRMFTRNYEERVEMDEHPLQIERRDACSYIRFIKLEYYESIVQAPIPRMQDVPADAFGLLHSRAILCATSQSWFYQNHPDPKGVKLSILRSFFFPKLRRKYPNTDILLFDDWMCCPQRPRTQEDDRIFRKAMGYMNSIYLYCDAVLHVTCKLPPVDSVIHRCVLRNTDKLNVHTFINTVQVVDNAETAGEIREKGNEIDERKEENDATLALLSDSISKRNAHPVKNDIIRYVYIDANAEGGGEAAEGGGKPASDHETTRRKGKKRIEVKSADEFWDVLKRHETTASSASTGPATVEIGFQHCPHGRRNPTDPDDRGWLFLERITTAIKAASAGKERFDDVVMSNSVDLVDKIYVWSEMLRGAVKKRKNKRKSKDTNTDTVEDDPLRDVLWTFQRELSTKAFTYASDRDGIDRLMCELVVKFRENWQLESQKQKNFDNRARDILLRWGTFTPEYCEAAGLTRPFASLADLRRFAAFHLLLIFVGAFLPAYFFSVSIAPPPDDDDVLGDNRSAVAWMRIAVHIGAVGAFIVSANIASLNAEFGGIPIGRHTVRSYLLTFALATFLIFALGYSTKTIIPFNFVPACFVTTGILEIICSIKCVPLKDARTGAYKWWNFGSWLFLPPDLRFSAKARYNARCTVTVLYVTVLFVFAYPLLGGLFYQSGMITQAILVPVFTAFRIYYDYLTSQVISKNYGSDKTPPMAYFGAAMHISCMCFMIISAKHTFVFTTILFSNIGENFFFVWCLYCAIERRKQKVLKRNASMKIKRFLSSDPRSASAKVAPVECGHSIQSSSLPVSRLCQAKGKHDPVKVPASTVIPTLNRSASHDPHKRRGSRRPFRRSTSIFAAIQIIRDDDDNGGIDNEKCGTGDDKFLDEESEIWGTCLYIVTMILQREMIEITVPIQAFVALTTMYMSSSKLNAAVFEWDLDEYISTTTSLAIDMGLEMIIFAFVVAYIKRIFPQISSMRILCGVTSQHGVHILVVTISTWIVNLMFQYTYSGIDMTLGFEWLQCGGRSDFSNVSSYSTTFLGGYRWEKVYDSNGTNSTCSWL